MAQILKLGCPLQPSHTDIAVIEKASLKLAQGGAIIFPTDTVYGLIAVGSWDECVSKINLIKQRELNTPVAILTNEYCKIHELILSLVQQGRIEASAKALIELIPGPLTLVIQTNLVRNILPEKALPKGHTSVGIRTPKLKSTNLLIEKAEGYVFASSANITGAGEPASFEDCQPLLSNPEITLAVDAGILPGIPSAVVKIMDNGTLKVIRPHPKLKL